MYAPHFLMVFSPRFRYFKGMNNIIPRAILWMLMLVGLPPLTWAQDASIPGEVAAAHPTLEHISVDWLLDGDANGDGRVSVRFRVEGSSAWRAGLDLVHVPAGSHEGVFLGASSLRESLRVESGYALRD